MRPLITADNSIQVTSQTTVAELQEFLKDRGDGLKLRGKANPGGQSYTLYLDSKSSSQWERMTRTASKRNDLAKKAVGTVFSNFDKLAVKNGASDENGGSIGKRLLSNINDRLTTGRHALRAGPLRDLAASTTVMSTKLGLRADADLGTKAPSAKQSAARGPVVNLPLNPYGVTLSASRVLLVTDAASRAAALSAIAGLINVGLDDSALTPDTKNAVVLSSGDSVRDKVEGAISDRIKGQGGVPPDNLKALVKEGFDQAASGALKTKQVGPRTPAILDGEQTNIELPTIEIGGEQYNAKKKIDEGGSGVVYLYASVSDPDKAFAFKIIKPEKIRPGTIEEEKGGSIIETLAHQRAARSGASEVIGLEGVVRLDDGTLGIATELAPNGSVFDLASSLKGLTGAGPGQITNRQADLIRIATFKGLLQGLRAMDRQDMVHMDFKSANCLIGSNGKPKLIDFGASSSARTVGLLEVPDGLDNPRYVSPELHVFNHRVEVARKAAETANQTALRPNLVTLLGDPKTVDIKGNPEFRGHNKLADLIFAHHDKPTLASAEAARTPPLDHKQDVWGAGTALLELFTGKLMMDDMSWNAGYRDAIVAWASSPQGGFSKTPIVGSLIPPTGNGVVDDLLNKMLAADPADRIDVNQALAHDLFKTPGVDDPALFRSLPSLAQHGKALLDSEPKRDKVALAARRLGDFMLAQLDDVLTAAQKARLSSDDCSVAERKAILGGMSPAQQALVQKGVDELTTLEAELAPLEAKSAVTRAAVETAKAGIAKLA